MVISKRESGWMAYVLDMEANGFDGAFSGAGKERSVAERLVRKGILKRKMLVVCDGDGFAGECERWRFGYCLTDGGRGLAKAIRRLGDETK
jgi:hypothetical protein